MSAPSPYDRLVRDARAIFSAGVRAVPAPALLARFDPVAVLGAPLNADRFHRVLVLGAGKAAMATAGALDFTA